MKALLIIVVVSIFLVACAPSPELEKTKSELAAAQLKITSLEIDLARAQLALEQAEADTDRLQTVAADPRQLPLKVHLRRTGERGIYQLVIKNQSNSTLGLRVIVSAMGKWQDLTPFIESGRVWTLERLASGDSVKITNDAYDPQSFIVQ